MLKIKISFVIVLLSVFLGIPSSYAGYVVDGDVADWGVVLGDGSDAAGYLDTNTPNATDTVDFITEDNASSMTKGWYRVGPGYTFGGKGYDGNAFDTEAIYLDNDSTNLYIAVITGLPIQGATAPGNPWFLPGDIGISLNGPDNFEYAIDVSSYDAAVGGAHLYNNAVWNNSVYSQHAAADPWCIAADTGVDQGTIDFVYGADIESHHVLEACIPLDSLGIFDLTEDTDIWVHWAMQCGNDYLTLNGDVNPVPTPEPATVLLLGPALLGLIAKRKKRV
ncbi:MAG: PEP-CTERM sorting domain-containing protein [Candidatus Omnitrophota bacterium]